MDDRTDIYVYERLREEEAAEIIKQRRITDWRRNFFYRAGRARQALGPLPLRALRAAALFLYNIFQRWSQELPLLFSARGLLLALTALILARALLLGELSPFVFAFLAAFGWKDMRQRIMIAAGALIGFTTVMEGIFLQANIVALLALAISFQFLKFRPQQRWWVLSMTVFAVLLICKSALLMMGGVLTFYYGMVLVFESIIGAMLCFVLMQSRELLRRPRHIGGLQIEDIAALIILGVGLVLGLEGIVILGLSVSNMMCRLGILTAAFVWGSGAATMAGVMAGLIPSLSSNVFTQTLGMYAVSGLLAGLFRQFGRLGIMLGFLLGNLALSMFLPDSASVVTGLWESLVACALFLLVPESLRRRAALATPEHTGDVTVEALPVAPDAPDRLMHEATRHKIHRLANVFDELGASFSGNVAEPRGLTNSACTAWLYDELAQGFCDGCSRHDRCWEEDAAAASQELLTIFRLTELNGEARFEDIPQNFKRRCLRGRELVTTVNRLYEHLHMSEFWWGKIDESRRLLSRQFAGAGNMVRELAAEFAPSRLMDMGLREELLLASEQAGYQVLELSPVRLGSELRLDISVPACGNGYYCAEALAPFFSELLQQRMVVTARRCSPLPGRGRCAFTLQTGSRYRLLNGSAQVARDGICGDSIRICRLREGMELVVLSDGMGTGQNANRTSRTAVDLLENMLNSGLEKELALQTVNSVLLLRDEEEVFTTVDMMLLNLGSGEADFIKTAAAPSFIRHQGEVSMIRSSSLPVGIMDKLDVYSIQRRLTAGDMVLMISDGLLDVDRENVNGEEWLFTLLNNLDEDDPQTLAEIIIHQALMLCNRRPRDDMSVICLKLTEAD
ncbi:MAG: stage II sporulation protein E [Syntrophomonadaceae bacterium]|nr:stage II sporulation protein E [Syntrophomonadaceae bacterium]